MKLVEVQGTPHCLSVTSHDLRKWHRGRDERGSREATVTNEKERSEREVIRPTHPLPVDTVGYFVSCHVNDNIRATTGCWLLTAFLREQSPVSRKRSDWAGP